MKTYAQPKTAYYCTPCNKDCDVQAYDAKGQCPHCGMDLVLQVVPLKAGFVLPKKIEKIDRSRLDSLFNALSKSNLAMGSIAIAQNGNILYAKAIGNADMEAGNRVPANTQTEYSIGSVSKIFTAVMIFQLIEEKKITLGDKLSAYFPLIPNASLITIRDLLNHHSGLFNFNNENQDDLKYKPQSKDQLLAKITNGSSAFQPGTAADYNNYNYMLLSYIIEKLYHQPYKDVLSKQILSRLQLNNTYYNSQKPNRETRSFNYVDGRWIKDQKAYLNNFSGAGAIISTPTDLVKFADALFNYKILSKSSVDKMQTLTNGYGMGIFPFPFYNEVGLGHEGRLDGAEASLRYYPAQKLAIAYCTNAGVVQKADILNGVLCICFRAPYAIPTFAPVALNSAQLKVYDGTYESRQSNIKVVCTHDTKQLFLQIKGQQLIADCIGKDEFMNAQQGFFFSFNDMRSILTIKDFHNTYYLTKRSN
jgi:D-alanyl-D-alanine carboxypeptidase